MIVAGETFDPVAASRRVMRLARTGGLGTLGADGHPFVSLVTVATTVEGEPILLLSDLAVHTQNLAADDRASLLLVAPGGEGGDPLAGARVSLLGRIGPADDNGALADRFLARHPGARGYAGFKDFAFRRFAVESGHLVSGFGRIVDLPRSDLLIEDPAGLAASEAGAVAHMNEDHADAIGLYATRLLGEPEGPWRLTGLDPHGLDLECEGRVARLDFPTPVTASGQLRRILVELAQQARAQGDSPAAAQA